MSWADLNVNFASKFSQDITHEQVYYAIISNATRCVFAKLAEPLSRAQMAYLIGSQ